MRPEDISYPASRGGTTSGTPGKKAPAAHLAVSVPLLYGTNPAYMFRAAFAHGFAELVAPLDTAVACVEAGDQSVKEATVRTARAAQQVPPAALE